MAALEWVLLFHFTDEKTDTQSSSQSGQKSHGNRFWWSRTHSVRMAGSAQAPPSPEFTFGLWALRPAVLLSSPSASLGLHLRVRETGERSRPPHLSAPAAAHGWVGGRFSLHSWSVWLFFQSYVWQADKTHSSRLWGSGDLSLRLNAGFGHLWWSTDLPQAHERRVLPNTHGHLHGFWVSSWWASSVGTTVSARIGPAVRQPPSRSVEWPETRGLQMPGKS